jgi:heme A synthase
MVVAQSADSPARLRYSSPQGRISQWLPLLSVGTAVGVYGLVIFGSHVRVTESGMGCPDWPLCSGRVGPINEFHALMEQTHRYIAATVSILVVTTAFLALRAGTRPAAVRPALFTVGAIVVQIALGAWTVMDSNGAPTVAMHLIAGLALLGGATLTAVCVLVPRRVVAGRRLGTAGWLGIGAAIVLLVSGSLVVNAEAAQACASVPLCPSDQPAGLVRLHLIHRGTVVLAAIALFVFAAHAWRRWRAVRAARPLAATLAALIVTTAGLGIVSALMKAPPAWQDLHLGGAAGLLVASVALAAVGWLNGADHKAGEAALPAATLG